MVRLVSIDLGSGFTLIKFSNAMYCNNVLQSQPWFVAYKFIVYKSGIRTLIHSNKIFNLFCYGFLQKWKKNFDPLKDNLQSVLLWILLPVSL